MRPLAILAILLASLLSAEGVPKPVPVLEFRLVSAVEREGLPKLPIAGGKEMVCLEPEAQMDCRAVAFSRATLDDRGRPQVDVTFTPTGAKTFAEVTRKCVGRRLAILIDGKVISAPTIQAPIQGGKAVITGRFTMREARAIADRINRAAKKAR